MGKKKSINYGLFFYSLVYVYPQDKNYNTRLLLILKHPDLFYKIAIIAYCVYYFCCCRHGYHFDESSNNSGIKSIFIVFETFKYLEDK